MSAKTDHDAQLMLRVRSGDGAAFEELVEKYKLPIINYVSRSLGDRAEAEDIAQNVFIQVFKAARQFKFSARFSTWLYTIARNRCLNELRRRARHRTDPFEPDTDEPDAQPWRQYPDTHHEGAPEALLFKELEQRVEQALTDLPESQRTAILLFREEMTYEEIALVLGVSLACVKSLIYRGRQTLKNRLRPYLQADTAAVVPCRVT